MRKAIGNEMRIIHLPVLSGYETLQYCEDAQSGLRALISIHSTKHGPAAGGCRFWDYATLEEAINDVQRLSRGMTYKNRAANLPLGGGKAVIIGNKKTPQMLRAFGRFVATLDGAYYTAEDVGISPSDMKIVSEETNYVAGLESGEFASGDPSPVTARGVYLCLKRAVEYKLGKPQLKGVRIAVQGLGHVGWHLAQMLHADGAKLFVTDLNNEVIANAQKEFNATPIALDEIYDVDADVFSPCAMGSCLNNDTVKRLKVSVVAGAANNQLAEFEIGNLLNAKNIFYAPDYVVNAGGIINVSMEIQKIHNPQYLEERLLGLPKTLDMIIALANTKNIGMHEAADQFVEAQLTK